MTYENDYSVRAHKRERIKLLQDDPDRYFAGKPRITFGFVGSDEDRRERMRLRKRK